MPPQELLLYTPMGKADGHRLEEAVASVVPREATEMVHTPSDLAHRLRRLNHGLRVAVLMAPGRKELRELLILAPMLERLRVILILPDADPQTISQGHSLRPRYLTLSRGDFQDVAQVLGKILGPSRSAA
jgi:hypothetical protein